jgi:two-component system NtrC family sensor kinase
MGILPLFMVFVTISVILQNHFQEQEMIDEASVAANTYANIIKEAMVSMMVNDLRVDTTFIHRVRGQSVFDTLDVIVNELRLRPEILNNNGMQRGHRRTPGIDSVVREVLDTGEQAFLKEGMNFRAVVPFQATEVCQRCHAVPAGYVLGAADLRVSLERVAEASGENWRRSVIIFLLFSLVALTFALIVFSRFVTRPVDRLVRATTEISRDLFGERGDTSQIRGSLLNGHRSLDELGYLTLRFDQMRATIRQKVKEIDEARTKLSARNVELENALDQLRSAQEEIVRNERLAVAGKMTAQLSHEINNPIHNIQSLLESSLKKVKNTEEVFEIISIAQEEVNRMANLTRQMLDFSRGNTVQDRRQEIDPGALLNEVVLTCRNQLAERRIGIALSVADSLPPIHGSRDRLKQVFLNLIINAADAITPPGSILLNGRRTGDSVSLRVSDTGCGIQPDHLGRIFDAFFTTKKEVSGVGLGLFVSYGIVRQHGGDIHVASEPGKGTTFTVELPIADEVKGTTTGQSYG